MSVASVTTGASIFHQELYTVNVNGKPYDSAQNYDVTAVYTVKLNYGIEDVPLVLLYAAMQIGLADVASYRAESYMEKVQNSQNVQVACSTAIAEAEKLKEGITAGTVTEATVTQELVDACQNAGVPFSLAVGSAISTTDLDTLIVDLELAQEAASSSLHTDMIYAEEYIGQFNAYLNGGSSNIDDLTNALQSIAGRI